MLLIVMHVQNLIKIHVFMLKILSGNKTLTSFKGRNSVMNWRKWTLNNPKLDVVNINAYVKFGQNQVIHSRHWVETKFWHHSRAITLLRIDKNWYLTIPSYWCRQYQCICKIWSKSIKVFPRYWAEMEYYGWTDRRTDGQTDGQPENSIPPPHTLYEGGIIIL